MDDIYSTSEGGNIAYWKRIGDNYYEKEVITTKIFEEMLSDIYYWATANHICV